MNRNGIDISSHQGEIDFQRVKAAGASFVIIKAGQGTRQFGTFREKYLPAVLAAGLDWGAYWWSDAVTAEEAGAEASAFVRALEGLRPTFPVYMDQEYGSPPAALGNTPAAKQLRTDMVLRFLKTLRDAGYYPGLYSSTDWLRNWLYDAQLRDCQKWVAQYASQCTYPGAYGIWQHHGDVPGYVGRIDGISVPVDLNECYVDYPAAIKKAGLNNWEKPSDGAGPYRVYTLSGSFEHAPEAEKFAAGTSGGKDSIIFYVGGEH